MLNDLRMGKKNLEQLFKDTFKDFHEVPDEKVWQSIETSLDKKKQKKRVIPIWWRLGGVAALLAVLFYVINPFGNQNNDGEIIAETENNKISTQKDSIEQESDGLNLPTTVDETQQLTKSSSDNGSSTLESKEAITENDSQNTSTENKSIKIDQQLLTSSSDRQGKAVQNRIQNQNGSKEDEQLNINKNSNRNAAVVNNTLDNKSPTEVTESEALELPEKNEAIAVATLEEETKNKILPSEENKNSVLQKEKVPENTVTEEAVAQNEEKSEELEKRSIFEVIDEQPEDAVAENSQEKWSVGPSVAPVYFNATGEGSPIHSNFASNSKSGNINLSYGLTVAYNLSKKLKVRSGVHRVDFGYDTNEVIFSSSLEGSTNELIDNISYSQTSRNLVLQSKNNAPTAANDALFEVAASESPALDGKMVQQLGYIEVPVELNYALIDNKFGVNLIGGVSSLFLVDNSVLLESEGLVTEVGEANNANSVNFSTNVGIGLNYKFSPKAQLNLEPVFKYQLNTFSETAGPFRPFSVGVYSGVTFKF